MPKPAYGGDWSAIADATVSASPVCAWCGATSDLCADHLVPGKPHLGTRTLCRSCNSRRAKGAHGPRRTVTG